MPSLVLVLPRTRTSHSSWTPSLATLDPHHSVRHSSTVLSVASGDASVGCVMCRHKESAGAKTASGLGVALFALTSALSRMGAGILSDSYPSYLSRLGWITSTTVLTLLGRLLSPIMSSSAPHLRNPRACIQNGEGLSPLVRACAAEGRPRR
eukprot:6394516-Amphidinium_carterae.1